MRPYRLWIYFDESGDVAHPDERYALVALIMTDRRNLLQRIVTDTKRNGPKAMPRGYVLHAATEYPEVLQYLLRRVAKREEVRLGTVVFDKRWWVHREHSLEAIYQALVAHAASLALSHAGVSRAGVQLILEQRYTNRKQRDRLVTTIADQCGLAPGQIVLERKSSSEAGAALQVADAVAWSWYQKLERGDSQFADLVTSRVIFEEMVTIDRWGAIGPISGLFGSQK